MRHQLRWAGLWALARLYRRDVATVLMYHSVSDDNDRFFTVPPAEFRRQLRWLKETGHAFVPIDRVAAAVAGGPPLGPKDVCLTFDDGYRDNLTQALPLLEEFEAPAVIYVATGYVRDGQSNHGLPICSVAELNTLAGHPLVTLGGHTDTHPKLTRVPAEVARAEIVTGKRLLEDWIGRPVAHFAYPKGDHDPATAAMVEASGFESAVTVKPTHVTASPDRFRIGRISVDRGLPFALFRSSCTEAFTVYSRLRRLV